MKYSIFDACRSLSVADVARELGFRFDRKRAYCPFCGSHRANMSFNENLFHCFACGTAGDAVKLVELALEIRPYEAAQWLDKKFGLNYNSKDVPVEAQRRAVVLENQKRSTECKARIANAVVFAERYISDHPASEWDDITPELQELLVLNCFFDMLWEMATSKVMIFELPRAVKEIETVRERLLDGDKPRDRNSRERVRVDERRGFSRVRYTIGQDKPGARSGDADRSRQTTKMRDSGGQNSESGSTRIP